MKIPNELEIDADDYGEDTMMYLCDAEHQNNAIIVCGGTCRDLGFTSKQLAQTLVKMSDVFRRVDEFRDTYKKAWASAGIEKREKILDRFVGDLDDIINLT